MSHKIKGWVIVGHHPIEDTFAHLRVECIERFMDGEEIDDDDTWQSFRRAGYQCQRATLTVYD